MKLHTSPEIAQFQIADNTGESNHMVDGINGP